MKLNMFSAPFAPPLHRLPLQVFGVLWLLALPFALLASGADVFGNAALSQLGGICMAVHCLTQMDALRSARRTLERMRAPNAAWAGSALASLRSISLVWLLLSGAMALRYALTSPPGMEWTGITALLSVVACIGTAINLSRQGFLPRNWSWLPYAATAVLLMLVAVRVHVGAQAGLYWINALPPAILLALTLAWPVMAGLLYRQWRTPPSSSIDSKLPAAPSADLTLRLWQHMQRYTLLHEARVLQPDGSSRPLGAGLRWMIMMNMPLQALIQLHAGWGQQLNGLHFTAVFFLAVITAPSLLMRDLHWRHLLAPRGRRSHSLAFRIYFSTLSVQLFGLLLLGVPAVLLNVLFEGLPLAEVFNTLTKFSLIAAELAFATAVAVLFMGLGQKSILAGWVLLVAFVLFNCSTDHGTFVLPFRKHPPIHGDIPLVLAGPGYAAALLFATCAILLIARRVWTHAKLQHYLRNKR